ncbi:hypothetical protein GQ42DRAFT_155673 [Ramicandelaber brevisporus]|nr:hypothetical protein GQ42DRAFT_155673 [Ramicandelaber brevisporus]
MSTKAKATFALTCLAAVGIVGGVHYVQGRDRLKLREGVIRNEERREQRLKNKQELEEQQRLQSYQISLDDQSKPVEWLRVVLGTFEPAISVFDQSETAARQPRILACAVVAVAADAVVPAVPKICDFQQCFVFGSLSFA